ncbi:MAG: UvrD-helicase domain-containing protein [Candidatus Izimaplasma sp.]|nr:UvrD-helicase domain-containing protein [Candidatus Izimaplasma bacterium]
MKYTTKQLQAINHEGENILVSASAGSGKTGVLKARVIRKIKNGVDIDKLIVLTFTKAAAEEMKSRIIKELEELELTEQIIKLDNAIISTFDAFTLRLVNEYHYLLHLPGDVSISDKILIDMESKNLLKDIIKEYYQRDDQEFHQLVKLLFASNDDFLEKAILTVAKGIKKIPNYQTLIKDYNNQFFTEELFQSAYKKYFEYIKADIIKIFNKFLEYYDENYNQYDIASNQYLEQVKQLYVDLVNETNPDKIIEMVKDFKHPSKPRKPKEVDVYLEADPYKPLLKKLKQEFEENLIEGYALDKTKVLESKPRAKIILEMASKYLLRLSELQYEKSLYSYDDIMSFAIRLFEENPDIKHKYINSIDEILVDEYQDTNDLQDYFISLISNNNIFMVGDVKQSIYRFRDANPKNFTRIFNEYEEKNTGKAIRLKENFRSNQYLLDVINTLFLNIMSEKLGGVNYKDNHSLISGYGEDYGLNEKNNPIIEHYYNSEAILEKHEDLSKSEIEAHIVGKSIVKKIADRQPIFTGEEFRPIEYKDITILVDRKTSFSKYKKILSSYGIPIDVYSDEEFVETEEIIFLFQFLLLIQTFREKEVFNKYFKKAFYSVSRSFVYQIEDQIIIDFLVNEDFNKGFTFDRLDNYSDFKKLKTDLEGLLEIVDKVPNYQVIDEIYNRLNIYGKIAELDNPEAKENKLDYFRELVFSQKETGFNDLIAYLEFINEQSNLDIEYNETREDINAIKLMTIHKAKGLQFPIVYLIGLNKKFNFTENKELFNFSPRYGVLTHSYHQGFHRNFLENLYLREISSEDDSEKVRLLYVALTRAKEEINLVLEAIEDFKFEKIAYNKYIEMLYDGLNLEPYDIIFDLTMPKAKTAKAKTEVKTSLEKLRFDFKKQLEEEKSYSKTTNKFISDDTLKAIQYGDEIHKLLEKIDYNNLDESLEILPDNIKASIISLTNTKLFKGFNNPTFYQEYEFFDQQNNRYINGIIDLLVIDENKAYIIDYKLKSINDEAYIEQLKGYKQYLKKVIDLKIDAYLYSLIDRDLKQII